MLTSPIATFINHDLHNKFAILRNATGMIEMLTENYPEGHQENLKKQTELLNQTIDRLSASVINITNCMNLGYQDDRGEKLSINYHLDRIVKNLGERIKVQIENDFPPLQIQEEKFVFIIETVIQLINNLSPDSSLNFKMGSENNLQVLFKDNPGDKSELKNVRELLMGKLKPEALPHQFNLFFANYLLLEKQGKIQLEFLEPGLMAITVDFGLYNSGRMNHLSN